MRMTLVLVYLALLALLALSTGLAFVNFGGAAYNTTIALLVAGLKAALVVLYFMEVRASEKLVPLFVLVGFFWLGILITLTMTDYVTRGWLPSGQ